MVPRCQPTQSSPLHVSSSRLGFYGEGPALRGAFGARRCLLYQQRQTSEKSVLTQYCSAFQTTGNILHFCSVGLKISALQPLTADPVLSWDRRVTSVAVTSTGHHTVALLGTEHGTLKKVSAQTEGLSRHCTTSLIHITEQQTWIERLRRHKFHHQTWVTNNQAQLYFRPTQYISVPPREMDSRNLFKVFIDIP